MSANVAVIYTGGLVAVAEAFGEAAGHFGAVRVLRVAGGAQRGHAQAGLGDLEWADGIAFGTSAGEGAPAPELMRFIESSRPLWTSGRLYAKAVTVFTDEPEHLAPDSVLHPVYDALYRWGAVIVGPKAFELKREARPGRPLAGSTSPLPAPRLRSAQYRAAALPAWRACWPRSVREGRGSSCERGHAGVARRSGGMPVRPGRCADEDGTGGRRGMAGDVRGPARRVETGVPAGSAACPALTGLGRRMRCMNLVPAWRWRTWASCWRGRDRPSGVQRGAVGGPRNQPALGVLAQSESVFALANSHIGLRGNLDEGEPSGLPGTYLTAFYEVRPLPYTEAAYGDPESGQTVVNVTNGKLIRLLVDDEPFDVRYGELRAHEGRLDLRAGVLERRVEWVSPAGWPVRLVSFTQRAVAAICYEVEAAEDRTPVVVQSELVANESLPGTNGDPRAAARHTGWQGLLAAQREYLDNFWEHADVSARWRPGAAVGGPLRHVPRAAGRRAGRAAGHPGQRPDRPPAMTATCSGTLRRSCCRCSPTHPRRPSAMCCAGATPHSIWRGSGPGGLGWSARRSRGGTIRGQPSSPYWPAGTAAFHINADIAGAVIRYQAASGGEAFERGPGLELLIETAQLWRSLGRHGAGGRFRIDGVTGPDEYSAIADNNIYTNLMAQRNLRAAVGAAARHPRHAARLGAGPEEAAAWRNAAEMMLIPYDERCGVHPQAEGLRPARATAVTEAQALPRSAASAAYRLPRSCRAASSARWNAW